MKTKCEVCKKTFNKKTYITAIVECPKYTCGLKIGTGEVTDRPDKKK